MTDKNSENHLEGAGPGGPVSLAHVADLLNEPGDPNSRKIPKYLRLSNALLTAIETGHFKAGDQLPPELEMADILPASHGTIRKALEQLAQQGVVVRTHGKGTFVAGSRQSEEDLWVLRFLRDDGNSLLQVFARVISIDRITEEGPWSTFLGSDDSYVRINSILRIGNEFEILFEFYVTNFRCGGFLEYQIDDLHSMPLRAILTERFNMPTLRLEQRIQCRYLTDGVCDLLNLKRGTVGIVWEVSEFTYRDAPASFRRIYLPPGHRYLELPEKRR